MRWSVTALLVLALASSALLAPATSADASWPGLTMDQWVRALKVVAYASWFLAVLWGTLVLAMGGPKEFYAPERAWRAAPDDPLPDVAGAARVRTDVVLETYRPQVGAYGRFVLQAAKVVLPAGGLVLAYAIATITLSGSWSTARVLLLLAVAVPAVVGFGWVALIFARSRIDIHPDGATVRGAFRSVVVADSPDCVIACDDARTALTDLGPLFIDRASGRRCAVWDSVFDIPGGSQAAVHRVAPRALVRRRPSRDLAPYVSLGERRPMLPVLVIVSALVVYLCLGLGDR